MDAYIYTYIEKSTLAELLETLYGCIELPVQLLDENGKILQYYGKKALTASTLLRTFLPVTAAVKSMPPPGNAP